MRTDSIKYAKSSNSKKKLFLSIDIFLEYLYRITEINRIKKGMRPKTLLSISKTKLTGPSIKELTKLKKRRNKRTAEPIDLLINIERTLC